MSSLSQRLTSACFRNQLRLAIRVVSRRAPVHTTVCLRRERRSVEEDPDQPVKFSTSKAAKWNSSVAFSAPVRDVPVYQPFSIIASIAVFLVYFLALREENDIDKELNLSLYERIPGLEKTQLQLSIDYNRKHGLSTEDLEIRLKEIENADNVNKKAVA